MIILAIGGALVGLAFLGAGIAMALPRGQIMNSFRMHAMKERNTRSRFDGDDDRQMQDTLSEQEYEEYVREYGDYLETHPLT